MKICNNCGSLSEQALDRCPSCQMPGSLVDYHADVLPQKPLPKAGRLCSNCGQIDMAYGPKCEHCRFPLPQGQLALQNRKFPLKPAISIVAKRKHNYYGQTKSGTV